ncbi:MAG: LytTR family DNA-binding domain-containing protein [Lachnospiraceae bacterium]|nr:LytTR family DNA-binding domain-containing protein [Lachnospiraceae bacterium]
MKLFVKEDRGIAETQVHILCKNRDEEIEELIGRIKEEVIWISGKNKDDVIERISVRTILYFESVDKTVFAYTQNGVYQTGYKLYELEEICPKSCFRRISKTTIANLRQITSIKHEEGRRLKIELKSREWLIVSRMYVNEFKEVLQI